MHSAWIVCALALIARSRAEVGQPARCYSCGAGVEGGACVPAAAAGGARARARASVCPVDRPLCATRASSPNFASVLSCSAAIESVCSLTHYKRKYEMTCVCSTELCNAPFSSQMQTELINFVTYNSANNGTRLNEVFWKLSHLANGSDANLYNKITEEIRAATEAPVWVGSEAATSIRTLVGSTMTPEGEPQRLVVRAMQPHEPSLRLLGEPARQAEGSRAQPVRRGDEPQAHIIREAEVPLVHAMRVDEPRAQAVRRPTAAPDDDEDEGEGSGAYEESPARRPSPSAPANPSSFLPAGENGAPTLFVNVFTIIAVLLPNII